jgi:hypothetical protein
MAESVNALYKTELHRNPAALAANGGHWRGRRPDPRSHRTPTGRCTRRAGAPP